MFQDGSVRQILSESRTLRWATTAASRHACQAKLSFTSHANNHGRWAPQLRRVSVVTIARCLSPRHSNGAKSYNRQYRRKVEPSYLLEARSAAPRTDSDLPGSTDLRHTHHGHPTDDTRRHLTVERRSTCDMKACYRISLRQNASLLTISGTVLTLFSKFFSSFPHGTCSLSVSRKYLALDALYHPLRASIPRSTTLRTYAVTRRTLCNRRGSHPLRRPVPKDLCTGHTLTHVYRPQRVARLHANAFQSELFPLHSPLLRESLLVSFPPPNYMLKFSGSSCSI